MSHHTDSSHGGYGHEHHEEHHLSYGTYIAVWVSLLILTGLTVAVAGVHLGDLNVFIALLIAAVKCSIVLLFFMHLRYESRLFAGMFLVCVFTLSIVLGIMYTDILFR